MTKEEVNALIGTLKNETGENVSLMETHISWVILRDSLVYKVKKPMQYSFLDYSTLQKRRYCCYKELILNRRIARGVYLDVVPVCHNNGSFHIDGVKGNIVDYAVKMKRLDEGKLMINLLKKNVITSGQITKLAGKMARFHHRCNIIMDAFAWRKFDDKFADIAGVQPFINDNLGGDSSNTIDLALLKSSTFLHDSADLLNMRVRDGFQRDVHGDLHAKNIFMYDDPVIFDCIEFNDEYRQMDVLNELAFCCMDLEAAGRHDFSKLLLKGYLEDMPVIRDDREMKLFIYFKAYRANVRAKVNALRAKQEQQSGQFQKTIATVDKYLRLMDSYMQGL